MQEDNEKDKQEGQKEDKDIAELDDPERTRLPLYSRFIFMTSRDFRRRVLNCCYSLVSSVTPSDNMSFVRNGVKPIRYYELRTMAILRNRRMDDLQGLRFIADIDITDINERMPIDMAVLEVLDIFRQRIQDWRLIDMMIQTHRVVKSLWHNGSKYLNSYTLHNQEHAVCLIHNVVRTVNNIDYLNLKQYDYFLLFQACYLHDISMIVHPDVSLFNSADPKAEGIISSWFSKIWTFVNSIEDEMESENGSLDIDRFHALRKEFGMKLIRIHKDIYNYFENRIRSGHAHDSAAFIRNWQKGYLSYLSPVDAEHIAEISDSHGWDAPDVYHRKSNAQSQLISVKYMMMLIRIADLLDLANDRIDLYLLQQNRSQMELISRFHWISHLITERYELDTTYTFVKDGAEFTDNHNRPIKEKILLNIYINNSMRTMMENKEPEQDTKDCRGFNPHFETAQIDRTPEVAPMDSLTFRFSGMQEAGDNRGAGGKATCKLCRHVSVPAKSGEDAPKEEKGKLHCPFICAWMVQKHGWLLREFEYLQKYLNSVNASLFWSEIEVRFLFDKPRPLQAEFLDDIRAALCK